MSTEVEESQADDGGTAEGADGAGGEDGESGKSKSWCGQA